ncbi:MAG: hypothetical protein L0H31_13410 [Nocardioidaceae bacterium]|nr:hypothetical protein [Nocardioidaceae bacterium]
MTSTDARSPHAGRGATIVSAVLGMLALLVSLAVIVLTDDDLDLAAGQTPAGLGGGPESGGSDGGGSSGGVTKSVPGATDATGPSGPAACTPAECPGTAQPSGTVRPFPFPPGAREPVFTDDLFDTEYCRNQLGADQELRTVSMTPDEVRDWYLANITSYGYGWGAGSSVSANPWRVLENDTKVPLGWSGSLTRADRPSSFGRLGLETGYGAPAACGPSSKQTFITVSLP